MESEEILDADKEMEEEIEMEDDEDTGRVQYVEDFDESDVSDMEVDKKLK